MWNRLPRLALVLFLGLATLIAIPTGAAEPVDAKKIDKLIEKLSADDFADREKATAELDAIGAPALESLRKATASQDVEVSKRAADLVAKIEKRAETVRVLAPKKVHLVYKETPLAEAAADFAKKSGYPISLLDPDGKLKDRTISLDTGDVTFWQALELFCDKAGLAEMDSAQGVGVIGPRPLPIRRVPIRIQPLPPVEIKPELEKPPQKEEAQRGAVKRAVLAQPELAFAFQVQAQAAPVVAEIQIIGGPAPAPGAGGFGVVGWNGNGVNQIILMDGKTKPQPTDASGAVRVRVMEKPEVFGPANEKEILLGLRLTAEPKLQIQQILNVRVEKAVDDRDQNLAQAVANVPAEANAPVALPAIARAPVFFGGADQYAPLRLKKGEKASKSLKELSGVVLAQVLTPATAAITADKIMDAAGKEFKGAQGGKIKVVEVAKNANGQITVKFELEQPANIFPANPIGAVNDPFVVPGRIRILPNPVPLPQAVPPAQGFAFQPPVAQAAPPVQVQIEVRPGVVVVGPGGIAAGPVAFPNQGNGITLEDEKGNAIQVVGTNVLLRRDMGGVVRENVTVFQPQKDQTPSKLVFSGSKSVSIEIPFALKNVILP